MVFNKKRFNIIVCLTLALICMAVVFSTIDYSAINGSKDPDQSYADNEDSDQTNPSDPSGNNPDNPSNNESDMPKLDSIITNGWTVFNYAMEILEKYDHRIICNQTIDAKDTTFNQGGIQKVYKEIYNIGGNSYVKVVADGSGVPLNMGENYTDYIVVNQNKIETKRDDNNSVNYSLNDYLAKFGILPNEIPYNLNKDSAKLNMNIVKPTSGAAYYELTLTLSSSAWQGYLKSLSANGGAGSNPKINSIAITMKVNLNYGYLMSLTATENYTINRAGFTAVSNSNLTMAFTYSSNFENEIEEIKSKF